MLSLFSETCSFAVVTKNSIILNFFIGRLHCIGLLSQNGWYRICEISLFKLCFFFALVIKVREGWLELHIKILFQVPLCCFYSFSPFRLLSRNTCICSKCLSLYTFTTLYDGEGDRKIYFTREKSYFPRTTPEGNMIFLGV